MDNALGDTASRYAPEGDEDGAYDTGDEAPPETEEDFLRLSPAATSAYVFIANPARDTVTRVSVPSLAALTATVGDLPSSVATASDYSKAVTLNEGSDDLSLVDADTLEVTNIGVRPNLNRFVLSDDAAWALAWYDEDADSSDPTDGVLSFNEVSLVRLATGEHFPMAVGYHPHAVRWNPGGGRAVIVSDDALALIDLGAETPEPRLIPIADDPMAAPAAEEVELSPDGVYAYVRQQGTSEILVVDLDAEWVERVPVGENPTDMDLSPSGTELSVVARSAQELWTFDATNPWAEPVVTPLPSAYGSMLYADGDRAILYTNATRLARYGVWDRAAGTITERSLVKPISSMGISPTGGSLLVFHTQQDEDGADRDSPFYQQWALTLIDLDDYRSNPMVLADEPSAFATSDDGRWGYFVMEGQPYVEVLDFESLLYAEIPLPTVPVHLGVLPESQTAWISQDYALGRISFYDPEADELDTITGFELNAGIEHD